MRCAARSTGTPPAKPTRRLSCSRACRAWHYADEGDWASKRDSAEWVTARLSDPSPVHRAVTLRGGGTAEWPSADEAGSW